MRTTPYTTKSGLQIGCNYEPPKRIWEPSRTETMLQKALLDGKSNTDWDGILIVVGCAFLMAVPYLVFAWKAA
jgi:hypothetical protein